MFDTILIVIAIILTGVTAIALLAHAVLRMGKRTKIIVDRILYTVFATDMTVILFYLLDIAGIFGPPWKQVFQTVGVIIALVAGLLFFCFVADGDGPAMPLGFLALAGLMTALTATILPKIWGFAISGVFALVTIVYIAVVIGRCLDCHTDLTLS